MNNMKLPDQCKFYWTGLADHHHREDWFWFLFEMKEYSCSCSATSWLYNKNKYFNSRGKHLWELVKTLYGKYVYDWKGNLVSMQGILDLQSYKFERSDVKMNLVNICTFFGCSLFWFSCCMYIYVYNLLHMLRNNQSRTFLAHVINAKLCHIFKFCTCVLGGFFGINF